MQLRRFRLPAAAVAAGLPALVAGMLAAPSATLLVGPADTTVRTVNVDPAPESPTDQELGLLGAHPPTDMSPQVRGAVADAAGGDGSRGVPVRVSGTALPARVLIAYRNAADALKDSDPGCHLHWSLVAAIGEVESGHAYDGRIDRHGRTLSPILGPVLDGAGPVAAISDSDGGRYDGDDTWDRAVGPMQFIPTSWAVWGQDGDGDGQRDPSDVDDAALATASYLCAGDRDLEKEKDRRAAVYSYNHSWDYVDLVLAWADAYASGTPIQTSRLAAPADGDARAAGGDVVAARPAGTGPTPAPGSTSVAGPPASAAPPTGEPAPTGTDSPPPAGQDPTASPSASCPTASPTGSPTGDPTASPTGTATETPTPTPTTPTSSPTGTDPSASPTATATPTTTPCATPTAP